MQEIKKQNRVKALVNENNIIIQKNKIKNLEDEELFDEPRRGEKEPGFFDKLKDLFETNAASPTFELKLTPKEREAYQKAMKKMKGGGPISYESTDKDKNEVCNKIKNEKNIYKYQLNMVDYC